MAHMARTRRAEEGDTRVRVTGMTWGLKKGTRRGLKGKKVVRDVDEKKER